MCAQGKPARSAVLILVAWSLTLGQGQVEQTAPQVPRLPPPEQTTFEIADLNRAPAAAEGSIIQLVLLRAYPLTDAMEAQPNEPLDHATAAYILVNLFAPDVGDEFPASRETAASYLAVTTGTSLPEDGVVTVGEYRAYMEAILDTPPDVRASLRSALESQYPALREGNPDAPLTRAGAAWMATIAARHLRASVEQ